MAEFVIIEECTIRSLGGSLYVKIPKAVKSEGVMAGDTLKWMRSAKKRRRSTSETFGAQFNKAVGESVSRKTIRGNSR